MPIEFVSGDLFASSRLDAFAHGCNCAGSMGKGIAVEFRNRWPRMYEEYKARCLQGRFCLGDVFYWSDGKSNIFNLGTQSTWRSTAKPNAIRTSITAMVEIAERNAISRIGLPRVGAG